MKETKCGGINCKCGAELKVKEFAFKVVEYCDECHYFDIKPKECTHESISKIPVKIKISNGAYQVRLYCNDCKVLESKSQKQANYNLDKLHETTIESFENYKSGIEQGEKESFDLLISSLRSNKVESIKDIYERYIKSDAWKDKRFKVLRRDSNICQICGKKATDVHHLTYAHLQSEYLFELVSLCRDCHIKYYHLDKLDFDIPNTQFDNETPF